MASCRLSLYHTGDLSIAPSAGAADITYYIQAERVLHDFAPGGVVDQCTGLPLEGELSVRTLLHPPLTLPSVHTHRMHPLYA